MERYAYSPYGEVTVLDANFSADADNQSDIANTYLYTGRWRDPITGLQLNRNRWFDSQLGRWLTRDPVEYEGGMDLYEYVGSKPLVFQDPLGFEPGCGAFGWNGYTCYRFNPPSDDAVRNGEITAICMVGACAALPVVMECLPATPLATCTLDQIAAAQAEIASLRGMLGPLQRAYINAIAAGNVELAKRLGDSIDQMNDRISRLLEYISKCMGG